MSKFVEIPRILTWLLAITLIISVIGVGYFIMTPQETDNPSTEFYILGAEGNAGDYPVDLSANETGEFIIGISNNDQRYITYTIAVVLNNSITDKQTVTVAGGETWEHNEIITIEEEGIYELKVLLFIGEEIKALDGAYRDLRLGINVTNDRTNSGLTVQNG